MAYTVDTVADPTPWSPEDGNSDYRTDEDNYIGQSEDSYNDDQVVVDNIAMPEVDNSDDTDQYEYIEHAMNKVYGFYEGFAWVQYWVPGEGNKIDEVYALVDKDFNIIFSDTKCGTNVKNGKTVCCDDLEIVIYDTDGNRVWWKENTPEDSFRVLCSTERGYMVEEHVTSFYGNQYFLYEMDYEGMPVTERIEIEKMGSDGKVVYLGEDIYQLFYSPYYRNIYNLKTGRLFGNKKMDDIPPFCDGISISDAAGGAATIRPENLQDEEAYLTWYEGTIDCVDKLYIDAQRANDGIYNDWKIFYDYKLQPLFSKLDYGEQIKVEEYSPFSGEYASVQIIGADGFPYVTFVNREGEAMFEPVCLGAVETIMDLSPFSQWDFTYKDMYIYSLLHYTDENAIGCLLADGSIKKYYVHIKKQDEEFLITPISADDDFIYFETAWGEYLGAISIESGDYIYMAKEKVPIAD